MIIFKFILLIINIQFNKFFLYMLNILIFSINIYINKNNLKYSKKKFFLIKLFITSLLIL